MFKSANIHHIKRGRPTDSAYQNKADPIFAYLNREYKKSVKRDSEDADKGKPEYIARDNEYTGLFNVGKPRLTDNLSNRAEYKPRKSFTCAVKGFMPKQAADDVKEKSAPSITKEDAAPVETSGKQSNDSGTKGNSSTSSDNYNSYDNHRGIETSLGDIKDFLKKITIAPIPRSLITGGLAGLGMYFAYPWLSKKLGSSPVGIGPDGKPIYATKETKRNWAIGTGIGTALLTQLLQYHPDYPRSLWTDDYMPKTSSAEPIHKKAYMLEPGNTDYIPLGMAREAIMANDNLSWGMRNDANTILNAIPGGYNTPINSSTLVGTAIDTGASALAGKPLGRIAAAAVTDSLFGNFAGRKLGEFIGVGNPEELGKTTGQLLTGLGLLKNIL